VILSAAAARTENIRLTSAVTVRAEIVAGRGSFIESYPLFGLRLEDYDSLFAEKLDLLLKTGQARKCTGPANTARLLPAKQSTLARCRIRCLY
jgi:hypothetical protein